MHQNVKIVPALVIGAGPAGLMAAEQLALAGIPVHVIDAMPSPGRKFLRAGIGGLNLTHSESVPGFTERYSDPARVGAWLQQFDAVALRQWALALGIETFVGSSGRVFPVGLKAAPLLRAWLQRLRQQGVVIHSRQRWLGFETTLENGSVLHSIDTVDGQQQVAAGVTIFAVGGGSWARLGSDGKWVVPLSNAGIRSVPLKPTNCGFDYAWSDTLLARYAGEPLKTVGLTVAGTDFNRKGEVLVSRHGVQGSLIYAASSMIRDEIELHGEAQIYWDLLPDQTLEQVSELLRPSRGKESVSNWLRKRLGLEGLRLSLFYELGGDTARAGENVANLVKRLPQTLRSVRPLDEAISTAGGVMFQGLDDNLMSVVHPGLFFAGEMLDWEAPTGGYLLNACFASGRIAGQGALGYLRRQGVCDLAMQ
ncbi:MAG: TIGR03862 family flavoprotein [Gammaproteobacteria bacterium]|nr:TIGR03862 family flavoprotein [Gammaproteobacteria bacterium]MDP2141925.1 TIGR03862 family flavoprotein [Gammaproteobacteria bacterium]MDP2347193.1 TIGR03862 family flavoprotein [Gammaproteobacteria bacterium]